MSRIYRIVKGCRPIADATRLGSQEGEIARIVKPRMFWPDLSHDAILAAMTNATPDKIIEVTIWTAMSLEDSSGFLCVKDANIPTKQNVPSIQNGSEAMIHIMALSIRAPLMACPF